MAGKHGIVRHFAIVDRWLYALDHPKLCHQLLTLNQWMATVMALTLW